MSSKRISTNSPPSTILIYALLYLKIPYLKILNKKGPTQQRTEGLSRYTHVETNCHEPNSDCINVGIKTAKNALPVNQSHSYSSRLHRHGSFISHIQIKRCLPTIPAAAGIAIPHRDHPGPASRSVRGSNARSLWNVVAEFCTEERRGRRSG